MEGVWIWYHRGISKQASLSKFKEKTVSSYLTTQKLALTDLINLWDVVIKFVDKGGTEVNITKHCWLYEGSYLIAIW